MTAFPYYDTPALAALEDQAQKLLASFAARGYTREEPSILQPAGIFLDRSGEEIRRRTFTLTDPSGRELCLRPDLTIPICRMAVESKAPLPARLCYHGLAFRQQPNSPDAPTQFYQAGAELLGLADCAAGDSEIVSLAIAAVRAAGISDFDMTVGDLAFFGALIDALDLPAHWRARLKRHFWRAGYFEELLQRLTRGSAPEQKSLLGALSGQGVAEARRLVEERLVASGLSPQGVRTLDEVVERLMEQAADEEASHLDEKVVRVITGLLDVSGPARDALARIRSLAAEARIDLDAPLAAMAARLDAIESMGVDPKRITFAAHFGRNMEYYTGFVFELRAGETIAGGGRYDTLLEAIGAGRPIPAVGVAFWTEAMLAAGGA
ncbi:MAG: ATP phosphoribosyltransferase regulatory subunit [Proteobacteria bacterium]|nr:ATP phosphoribosyltransferase regulatory subunit [Pseudomonadota bacterium]